MASGQVAQQLEITGSIPAVTLRTTGKSSHTHTHTHTHLPLFTKQWKPAAVNGGRLELGR